jgi:hypothetical protein
VEYNIDEGADSPLGGGVLGRAYLLKFKLALCTAERYRIRIANAIAIIYNTGK